MALRPQIVLSARVTLALGSAFVTAMLLGPFQGAERHLMLTDKEAHGLAFMVFTVLAFIAAPKVRRSDLVLTALALAAASEIAQALVGRDGNVADFMADGLGVAIAAGIDPVGRFWRRRGPVPRRRRNDRNAEARAPIEA
jgi:VanZ family protein